MDLNDPYLDDDIDLMEIMKVIWGGKKIIVLVTAIDELFSAFEKAGVGIYQMRNLHVLHASERSHVGGASSLDTAHSDVYSFVGPDDLARRLGPANGESPERR